ncbi:ABC transporter permease [Frankia sp. AgB32]|uniref:ABC transporter permease n=1 Tax=Frankia sp. AgB32 TaxID=631119 RepID=UPI00200CC9A4|nr:ABC transporter permease [Frankia sp. AgB32]MCK9897842.1 ABC transporter permease [Frankia sp. AgB32]
MTATPLTKETADANATAIADAAVASPASPRRGRVRWRGLPRSLQAGVVLSGVLVTVSVAARIRTPHSPTRTGVGPPFESPSSTFLFGTDQVGSDVFSRTFTAGLTDIGITLIGVAVAFVVGTSLGAIAGFVGGIVDAIAMRVSEILQSFPALLLAMLMASVLGGGLLNVVIVVAVLGIPGYLRLARAEIMSKKELEFSDAARLMGNRPGGVLFRHLLPNSLAPVISFTAINASWVAILVSSLGFVGVGIEPGTPEWGSMVASGRNQINAWWVSFFPGIAILLLALALFLLGDGVSDLKARRKW